jgi:rhodanese-related sulfurtransferase
MTTIHPDITMRELLEVSPGAQRALFKKYHIGGCSSCGFRQDETLKEVCDRNESLPVEEVVAYIEASREEDLKSQITATDLDGLLKSAEELKLIDIRTREEFDAAPISGAVFFTQEMMQEALMKWDRSELIIFFDHQGRRSMDATAYFQGHGFTNVKSLCGGADAWSREVDPSVPRYQVEA